MRVLDHWITLVLPSQVFLINPSLPGIPTCLWNPGSWPGKMPHSQQVFNKILVENGSHKHLLTHGFATTVSFEVWAPVARFLCPFLTQTVLAALS